jgi:hypothetical protein
LGWYKQRAGHWPELRGVPLVAGLQKSRKGNAMRTFAILEDNLDRQRAMRAELATCFPDVEPLFWDETGPMIAWLKLHLAEVVCIALDHDLELKPTGDGRWFDPGTGRDVADYLAEKRPVCGVIVHSTNGPAADGMQFLLQDAGWNVGRIQPYGDLEWVAESWMPLVRERVGS